MCTPLAVCLQETIRALSFSSVVLSDAVVNAVRVWTHAIKSIFTEAAIQRPSLSIGNENHSTTGIDHTLL